MGALAYNALSATVAAYLLWFSGVRRTSTHVAAMFTGVLPVSAALCAAALLGESLTMWPALGLLCVLGALLVFARPPRPGSSP